MTRVNSPPEFFNTMYLPLMIKTDNLKVLLLGAGKVAVRKLEILCAVKANVTIISPDSIPEIELLIKENNCEYKRRSFRKGDCKGFDLVIAATSDMAVNTEISEEAKALHIPVNVVDVPDLCTAIFPAVIRDGDFIAAISSGSQAPFLAAELRNQLREHTKGWGRWVEIGGRFRKIVLASVTEHKERRRLYDLFLAADMPDENNAPPVGNDLHEWIKWLEKMKSGRI